MKISLVVTDFKGKNFVFVSDKNEVLSLPQALDVARQGGIDGAYLVEKKTGAYLRTKASVPKEQEFEKLAMPARDISAFANGLQSAASTPMLSRYFERITDALGGEVAGMNTSIGIAQVKIDTANGLIKKGVYNPNPTDTKLPFKRLNQDARRYLYTYLIQSKHNLFFAAGYIRDIIDYWTSQIDISKRPEIIGTLYSLGYGKPHINPVANSRGLQIANEFYPLAEQWLDAL